MNKALTSFNCDPNSFILLRVLDYHSVSSAGGASGVRRRTSKRLRTNNALIGTSPNAIKAYLQFSEVNTSKNASLKVGKKPSLLI